MSRDEGLLIRLSATLDVAVFVDVNARGRFQRGSGATVCKATAGFTLSGEGRRKPLKHNGRHVLC
jgi:hypothetical protein